MNIAVLQADWGVAQRSDIESLLSDVASHLTRWLRAPVPGIICVIPGPETSNPITYYRNDREQPFAVQLTARDRKWSKFAYQFSHEFTHILSEYENLRENPNQWFHESLCELASVFAIRQMETHWRTCPPYPNWIDYSESLAEYAKELISRRERQLPEDMAMSTWLASEEESLRTDPYQRDKNGVVSYSLLPLFESEPTGWNAIRHLPNSSGMLSDYLRDWQSQVEPIDYPFLSRLIQLFQQ